MTLATELQQLKIDVTELQLKVEQLEKKKVTAK